MQDKFPIIVYGEDGIHITNLLLDFLDKFGSELIEDRVHIAPPKEALKYMKEYDPLSHYYDNFKGWSNSSWTSVDACYECPWEEVRHDTEVLEKWRKYNG